MNVEDVKRIISDKYSGVICKKAYGETTFFYNPDNYLKNGVYFCTIKESDGPNDKSSKLDREGTYRISTGITKEKYLQLFKEIPKRPLKGKIIEGDFDFSEENVILPHPIYGWMSWISVLTPTDETFEEYLSLIDVSYEKAKENYAKRCKQINKKK